MVLMFPMFPFPFSGNWFPWKSQLQSEKCKSKEKEINENKDHHFGCSLFSCLALTLTCTLATEKTSKHSNDNFKMTKTNNQTKTSDSQALDSQTSSHHRIELNWNQTNE